jgi:tRNA (guanine-N7-)-methyltransferase
MESKNTDNFIKILTSEYKVLDFPELFDPEKTVELDLGCGKGRFTTALAKMYPESLILAADVMIGRLRKLHARNEREGVTNMIPLRVEARNLLAYQLPDKSIDRLHLLCPDPWPKGKHRGNRLMCSNFMPQIHNVLKPGGHFHFSTDDIQYHDIVRRVVASSGLFEERNDLLEDIAHIKTDFELRWNEQGKKVHHILWRALPNPEYTSVH